MSGKESKSTISIPFQTEVAETVANVIANRLFERMGNHTEVHLTREQVVALCKGAIELGVSAGVRAGLESVSGTMVSKGQN